MLRQIHSAALAYSIDDWIVLGQSFEGEERGSDDENSSLDETAQNERAYVRGRLKEELGREPTEQEVDDWLRQHTEGY